MPVQNEEAQLIVPGIKRRNNELWKKIADVQNEHQNFLQRLGFVEAQAIHARFIDPAVANETLKDEKGKLMGHGIPWKAFEPTSPKDERRQIFESFNRAEFDLPDSKQTIQDLQSNASNKSVKRVKNSAEKYSNKSSVFRGTKSAEEKKSVEKYLNTKAKVDSGLRQRRATTFQASRNGTHEGNHSKSALTNKFAPLTLASKLPDFVGKNHSIIPNALVGVPSQVGNSPKGSIQNYLDSMNVYTTYEEIKREKTKKMDVISTQPNRPAVRSSSPFGGTSNKPVGYWDFKSNQAKTASANYNKFLNSIMYTGNPVTILKPPPAKSFHIPGLNHDESTQQVEFKLRHQAAIPVNKTENENAAARKSESPRKMDPARLAPRHVPGPKYDNIYIGPYSGSESERERDESVERTRFKTKSRRR